MYENLYENPTIKLIPFYLLYPGWYPNTSQNLIISAFMKKDIDKTKLFQTNSVWGVS